MNNEKNMGIELLRIVSMFSIMVLHVLGQGGVLEKLRPLSFRYELAWFTEIFFYFGVTVYALISGYVGVERRFHISNIVYVWLQVLFYTILITGIFVFVMPGSVGQREVLGMVFPIMTEQYWYYSAYVGVFFFIPMLNHAVITIYKRYLTIMLVAFIILFSVLPVFFDTDVYGIRGGYSFIWLMICYFTGAFIRHYDFFGKMRTTKLWGLFFLSVFLTWGFKFTLEGILNYRIYDDTGRSGMLIAYNSPTILLSAVSLLIIFSRIEIKKETRLYKQVALAAPLCFGVYLINCHPLIWKFIVKDRFINLAEVPAFIMLAGVLLSAALMFVLGLLADEVRFFIFEKGRLRERLRVLEDKVFKQ